MATLADRLRKLEGAVTDPNADGMFTANFWPQVRAVVEAADDDREQASPQTVFALDELTHRMDEEGL